MSRAEAIAESAERLSNEWLNEHGYSDETRQISVKIHPPAQPQAPFHVRVEEDIGVAYQGEVWHGAHNRTVAKFDLSAPGPVTPKALAHRVVARLPKALGLSAGGCSSRSGL